MSMPNLAVGLVPLLALFLDARFADPRNIPHPVCLIGRAYNFLEKPARAFGHERVAGVLCVGGVSISAGLLTYCMTGPSPVGLVCAVYLSFAGLAMGTLLREAGLALQAIESNDVEAARIAVGMLVSRDTMNLDKNELCRALAESVSENFNDALIAPFFWLVLGGPGALWAYKAVSTADSMWGYRTPKWQDLGWAGARLDDILAWIPARLSALLLLAGSYMVHCPGTFPGWHILAQDARSMKSPNSGWPMSMAAWLHNIPMGGPTPYFGEVVQKPILGPHKQQNKAQNANTTEACAQMPNQEARQTSEAQATAVWTPEAVRQLMRHVRISGLVGCSCLWALLRLVGYGW